MKINSVSYNKLNNIAYKGIVHFDRASVENNMKKYPSIVQQSILGNFDTLCDKLRSNTPDDQEFSVEYKEREYSRLGFDSVPEQYGYATIKYKGTPYEKQFLIRSRKDGKWIYPEHNQIGQKIYEDGFKDLRSLTTGQTDFEFAKQNYIGYFWSSSNLAKSVARAFKVQKMLDDEGLSGTQKVKIANKNLLAAAIAASTTLGDEGFDIIAKSLIGNIKTMMERLEQGTPEGYEYTISADSHRSSDISYSTNYDIPAWCHTPDIYREYFDVTVTAKGTNGKKEEYKSSIITQKTYRGKYSHQTGEDIYQDFNKLTNQITANEWARYLDDNSSF